MGPGTGPGVEPGTGGPLVCIKLGCGTCDTCGEVTPCCCDPVDCPPTLPPGEIPTPPDSLCLIGGTGVGDFENGNLIELWFSAKTRSCSKDYYLGTPSINWSLDFGCDLDGFHGEATTNFPGEIEVSQAAFYVKRNT